MCRAAHMMPCPVREGGSRYGMRVTIRCMGMPIRGGMQSRRACDRIRARATQHASAAALAPRQLLGGSHGRGGVQQRARCVCPVRNQRVQQGVCRTAPAAVACSVPSALVTTARLPQGCTYTCRPSAHVTTHSTHARHAQRTGAQGRKTVYPRSVCHGASSACNMQHRHAIGPNVSTRSVIISNAVHALPHPSTLDSIHAKFAGPATLLTSMTIGAEMSRRHGSTSLATPSTSSSSSKNCRKERQARPQGCELGKTPAAPAAGLLVSTQARFFALVTRSRAHARAAQQAARS